MATFGGYETVLEIYRHGLGSVARAKIVGTPDQAGEEPGFVVKAFQPPHRIASQEAIKPAVRSFLDRARIQQDVVTAGAKRWAPIYEAGAARDGAYYVTAFYSRSAVKLIAGRVKLSSQSLYDLIKAVLQGLTELKQFGGQPHGNLKPTNVLIAGEGEIDDGKVFLADPAAREQLPAAGGEAADLAAVGELLYQLVLHRPFRGSQSWPAMASPEWSRLGRKGETWRQFCNQLLNPTGADGLTLEDVTRSLEKLRDRTRVLTGRRVQLTALAIVLLIGSVGGWYYMRFRSDWRDLCLKYNDWFYKLDLGLHGDAKRLARLHSDPYIGNALNEIESDSSTLDPKKISGNELLLMTDLADRPPLSFSAPEQTRIALAKLRRFETQLSPEQWPLLRELSERARGYEARHWTSAAAYLQHLIDGVKLELHGDILAQIDQLIASQGTLRRELTLIEEDWKVIAGTEAAIKEKAPGDKVLQAFEPFASQYVQKTLAGPGSADLEKLQSAVDELSDRARNLGEVLQLDWTDKIDRDQFAKKGEIYQKPVATVDESYFKDWLREVQDFYLLKREDRTDLIADLKKSEEQVRSEINSLHTDVSTESPEKLKEFETKLADTSKQVDKLADKPWVMKDQRTGAITLARNQLQDALKAIRDAVTTERQQHDVVQQVWWNESSKDIADSAVINAAWKDWRGRLGVDPAAFPMKINEFQPLRTRADLWIKELRAAEQQFPPPPAKLGAFTTIAQAKREEKLAQALAAASPSGKGEPDLTKLKTTAAQLGAQYTAWCTDLPALLSDATMAKALLDDGYVPGDSEASSLGKLRDKWPSREVWNDVVGQPPVDAVWSRLQALAEIPRLSRSELAIRATAPKTPSIEWLRAAWQGLSRIDNPPWPASAEELRQEISIRQNLATRIDAISDAFRKTSLRDELKTQGPLRLASYLNSLRSGSTPTAQLEANLKGAQAAMDLLSVTVPNSALPVAFERYRKLATLPNVDAGVRFNLLLCGLSASAADPGLTDVQLASMTDAYRQEIGRLPTDVRSQAAGLMEKFAKISQADSQTGPLPSWLRTDAGNGRARFTSQGSNPQVLEFVEIKQAGKLPVYLCTTELSVGTFIAAIPAADWAQNAAGLLVEFQPGRDVRSGPRVWDWAPRGDASSSLPITISEFWLHSRTDDDVFDYFLKDSQFKFNRQSMDISIGGNPLNRSNLPMQYLPASTALYVASLMGCRLPTVQEWKAAEAINGTKIASSNLRDQTWQNQQAYAQINRGRPEWPDAGAYLPKAGQVNLKTGPFAQSVIKSSDGVLWFCDVDKDVDKTSSPPFHNLVGNVWEYVWEDPSAADRITDKTLHGWRSLLESPGIRLSVIGGSALSAPELLTTTPQPVDLGHGTNPAVPDAWTGFADVGMRLAFSERPKTPADRLRWIMSTQPYIGTSDASTTRPAS